MKRVREAKLAFLDRVIEDNRIEAVRADKIVDFGDGKYGQIMFHNGELVMGTVSSEPKGNVIPNRYTVEEIYDVGPEYIKYIKKVK